MKRTSAMLAAVIAFIGCASAPIAAFQMDKLRARQLGELCVDYHDLRRPILGGSSRLLPQAEEQLEAVLLEKGLPKKDLESARDGRIFIGMTRAGLYAALGRPLDGENKTVGPWGEHIQFVYGKYDYNSGSPAYVYTENGIITSWQD